jgi:hypothetical protein
MAQSRLPTRRRRGAQAVSSGKRTPPSAEDSGLLLFPDSMTSAHSRSPPSAPECSSVVCRQGAPSVSLARLATDLSYEVAVSGKEGARGREPSLWILWITSGAWKTPRGPGAGQPLLGIRWRQPGSSSRDLNTHVPLVDRVWGPQGLERTEVRKLTAAADGSAPPYQIIFSAYFSVPRDAPSSPPAPNERRSDERRQELLRWDARDLLWGSSRLKT